MESTASEESRRQGQTPARNCGGVGAGGVRGCGGKERGGSPLYSDARESFKTAP